MYVDDIVTGADTDAEAFQLYVDAKEILRQGSFNLRKFVSSSCNLQEQIDIRERSLTHPNPEPSPPSTVQATEESICRALPFRLLTICWVLPNLFLSVVTAAT